MAESLAPSLKFFKVISDETRLKILMILKHSEFTVGELVDILEIHQSNTSRHLTQLRDNYLVDDRREGALVYYRWSEALRLNKELSKIISDAWKNHSDHDRLEAQIQKLLVERKTKTKSFFDKVAGKYHQLAKPGGGSEALLEAFSYLLDIDTCADIGAGQGDLSLMLANSSKKVIAVDLNQKMLNIIDERANDANIGNIETLLGDLDNLNIPDSSVDLVVLSQVLHHIPAPEKAFSEITRILKPNGKLMLLDLLAHDQEWVKEKLGDFWLGFESERLAEWIESAKLNVLYQSSIMIEEGLPVILFIAKK